MRKGSECTRIRPETPSNKPMTSLESRSVRRASPSERDRPRQVRGVCGSRLLRNARGAATRLYRRARARVARALRVVSKKGSSSSCSTDGAPAKNGRRQKCAPVADKSHQSEAVEECIRFMNSSSRKYR